MLIKNINTFFNKEQIIHLLNNYRKQYDITRIINEEKKEKKELDYVDETYSLLTYPLIMKIKKLNGKVLEVGAANGVNSLLLKYSGIDVYPIDLYPGPGVEKMNHIEGIKKYKPDIVFICWPSLGDNTAYDILKIFNGIFIYIGEPKGHANANDKFFKLLNTEWTLIYKKPLKAFYNGYLKKYKNIPIINYFAIYKKK